MAGTEIRVAISGFAGLDNPEPGTAVARALRLGWRGSLRIDALGYDPWFSGAWIPGLADRLCLMPAIAQGDEAALQRILALHAEHRIDVLIPCLDLEIPVYARLARRLRRHGIRTLLPEPEDVYAVQKNVLAAFCYANGIAAPRTVHVPAMADVAFHADQIGYPLIVKGTVAGAARVESREQAVIEAAHLNAQWGGGVILQQAIDGDEYVVAMIARTDGRRLGHVAMRKIGLSRRGKAVVGAVVDDPGLERESDRILSAAHWRGPLELEFIRVQSTDRLYLLEINCRFPSWILLSHWAGCNLPAMLLREILLPGRRRSNAPRPGAAYVRDFQDIAIPAAGLEELRRFARIELKPIAHARRQDRPRAASTALRVGITGISAFDVVQPGTGVARALRGAPEVGQIYGLGYGPYESGLHRSRLLDAAFCLPDADDPDVLLAHLKRLRATYGLDVLFPCLDHELPLVLTIRDELAELGVRTLLPTERALGRRSKSRLFDASRRRDWGNFEIPGTLRVRTLKGLDRALGRLGYPVVLKGTEAGWMAAYDAVQARAAWASLRSDRHEREVLVQALVPGEEFAVAAVCGHDHRILAAVAVKKLLRCPRGNTWGAVVVEVPELISSLDRFLATIGWCGPIEAEFIRDATRERFILIELNPRFPAWVGFTADVGVNLPHVALLAALDRPPALKTPARDLLFLRSCHDISVDMRAFATLATKGALSYGP